MRTISIVIAGLGGRGLNDYGPFFEKYPEKYCVKAVADPIRGRVDKAKKIFELPEEMCFEGAEELFKQEKIADFAMIATMDSQHLDHVMKALDKGYDIILEKPIADNYEDCLKIRDRATELGRKILVCHVLRYAPFFSEIKKVLLSGELGEILNIDTVEDVGFNHFAHSFVRGNWCNKEESTPLIVQKCCHDTDIVTWLMGENACKVSSFGALKHFRKEKAPEGASRRCLDGKCKAKDACPYDAEKIYFTPEGDETTFWANVFTSGDRSVEYVKEALMENSYGRCVYDSDNNVMDNQVVNMIFPSGSTASLKVVSTTNEITRKIDIYCSLGQISGNLNENKFTIYKFIDKGQEPKVCDLELMSGGRTEGHGGGDFAMLEAIYNYIANDEQDSPFVATIQKTIHSHEVAFMSEVSRMRDGEVIRLD